MGTRFQNRSPARRDHRIHSEVIMSIESTEDFDGVREAGRVTTVVLDALVAAVHDGVATGELDAIAADVLRRHDARSAPAMVYGFPGTVLISVNDEIVHGIPGRRKLQRGDLVSLDATVEKDGYVADAARSVIVGDGSTSARQLIAAAESALRAALAVANSSEATSAATRPLSRTTATSPTRRAA